MFRVYVKFNNGSDGTHAWHAGLEALDLCRKLGVPDMIRVAVVDGESDRVPVTEEFARSHFERKDVCEEYELVYADMLRPGEFEAKGQHIIMAKLPPERVRELYVAGRIRELRSILEEAEAEVAALKAKLAEAKS